MTFTPRTHETGVPCCSSTNSAGERIFPDHPCPKCRSYFAAAASTGAPPDPYFEDLKALRASNAAREKASPVRAAAGSVEMHYDTNGTPDPYAAGIATMRQEMGR
jgi:hypothetical protein